MSSCNIVVNQSNEVATLESLLNDFEKDLEDPASIITAIKETIRIMKEDHQIEIQINLKKLT